MNVLFLAPQPFFDERGTPIAVDLVLKVLSERGDQVDVVTYHLGREVEYPGVKLHRIAKIPFIKSMATGFSLKKVICDIFLFFRVLGLIGKKRYQVVHAVEEAVFIALFVKLFYRVAYVYDMDSSLAQQMIEKYPRLFTPVRFLLNYFEGLAIRQAKAVVPVCEALSQDIEKYNPEKVLVLHDVSLLAPTPAGFQGNLRAELGVDGPIMMYVGNLEIYQGIDLLLESFSMAVKNALQATLVVVGGKEADIQRYQEKARRLDLGKRVVFLGPKPVEHLAGYLSQADILVSPRIKGRNTPMKIYSYLDSGKALLATDLPTHTQVLNPRVALLADPSPAMFSQGVLRLIEDGDLRQKLGLAGKQLIAEKHTYAVFRESLNALYDWLQAEVQRHRLNKNKQTPAAALPAASRKRL